MRPDLLTLEIHVKLRDRDPREAVMPRRPLMSPHGVASTSNTISGFSPYEMMNMPPSITPDFASA